MYKKKTHKETFLISLRPVSYPPSLSNSHISLFLSLHFHIFNLSSLSTISISSSSHQIPIFFSLLSHPPPVCEIAKERLRLKAESFLHIDIEKRESFSVWGGLFSWWGCVWVGSIFLGFCSFGNEGCFHGWETLQRPACARSSGTPVWARMMRMTRFSGHGTSTRIPSGSSRLPSSSRIRPLRIAVRLKRARMPLSLESMTAMAGLRPPNSSLIVYLVISWVSWDRPTSPFLYFFSLLFDLVLVCCHVLDLWNMGWNVLIVVVHGMSCMGTCISIYRLNECCLRIIVCSI